jgi:hypothetical protein
VTFLYSQYSRSRSSSSSYLINGDIRALFLIFYITLLFVIESIYTAVQARTVQIMYIDNRNYPGGPWAYFLATQNLPVNVMFYATLFVLTFLSDLLVVSRLNGVLDTLDIRDNSSGAVGSFGQLQGG